MTPTQDKQPKVGDVKGMSGGTTIYYTKDNLPQPTTKSTTPVITPDALKAPATPTVSVPKEPVQAATMLGEIGAGADAFTQQLTEQRTQAESTKNTALTEYINSLKNMQGPAALTNKAYDKAGVDTIQTELSTINNQILQEQQALKRGVERIQSQGGGLKIGAQSEIANLERTSLAKQADLYVIQMGVQGRYDAAKAAADRAVDAQLEQQKIYNDALRFDYEESKDIFTTAEQREFETLLSDRERALQDKANETKSIKDFALTALQSGAPTNVAQRIMNAKTLDEAIALGGDYLRPKAGTAKAPDLQNFGTSDNPIWKQYNPTTGQWEDVAGVGGAVGSSDEVQKSIDQLTFLRDVAQQATDLANSGGLIRTPVGPSAITRGIGATFIGNTSYKQLENKTDTLKTNVLSLMTDPSIRKFFGPQMSNADVRLIQSAGSTLDPQNQSEDEYVTEIKRLDDLLNRMETAVRQGMTQTPTNSFGGNVITAPDGTLIEIVD